MKLERNNLCLDETDELAKKYNNVYLPFFYEKGEYELIQRQDGIRIFVNKFLPKNPRCKIFFLTGFNESVLKYSEVFYEIYEQNVAIYCLDHRGQGFSDRLPHQNGKGYFDSFSSMVEDASFVFQRIKNQDNPRLPILAVAHSMGGCVLTHAVCDHSISPNAVVLCSPMLGISLSKHIWLQSTLETLIHFIHFLGFRFGYAPHEKPFMDSLSIEKNSPAYSYERYPVWRQLMSKVPALQLGGVTWHWLHECLKACEELKKKAYKNNIPTLLLQAAEEALVSNKAQDEILRLFTRGEKLVIAGARHEIFMETDEIRRQPMEVLFEQIKKITI